MKNEQMLELDLKASNVQTPGQDIGTMSHHWGSKYASCMTMQCSGSGDYRTYPTGGVNKPN